METQCSMIPAWDLHKIEIDPIAYYNPQMSAAEFEWLLNDIKVHGQKDPVLMFENKIVDGRHRLAVAKKLGIDLRAYHLTGTREEAESAVRSCDVRRNLSTSQIAMKCAYRIVESRTNPDGSAKPKSEWFTIKNLPEIIYKIIGKRSVETAIKMRSEYPEIAESVFLGQQTMTGAKKIIDWNIAAKEEADRLLQTELIKKAKYAREYAPEAMYFDRNEEHIRETYSESAAESYRTYLDTEEFYTRKLLVEKLVIAEHKLQECSDKRITETLEQTAEMRITEVSTED